jgi:hypothetical protein
MALLELIMTLFFSFLIFGLLIAGAAELAKVGKRMERLELRVLSLIIMVAIFLGVIYFGAYLGTRGYLPM